MVYEYPTNYSNGSIVTGPGSFFIDYPTSIIPQFGAGILTLIFLVTFAVGSFLGVKKALLTSCFITGIISIFFAVRGWVNELAPIGLGVVTVIIILLGLLEGNSGGGL